MPEPMMEVHYLNGRKRRIPESLFVADGESVVAVIDIALEDISEGLLLYYKHFEPMRPSQMQIGVERDLAGLPTLLKNDGYVVLVGRDELAAVERVYYEGKLELLRLRAGGELVNLHKVNSAAMLYLDGQGNINARLKIAEVYNAMKDAFDNMSAGMTGHLPTREKIASDLGVPETVLAECLEFQASYALSHMDYAISQGLPYINEQGEVSSSEDDEGDVYGAGLEGAFRDLGDYS